MTFKKIVGWLHLWLGLISGLIVFVVCITGCLWVFNKEINDWATPLREVAPRDTAFIKPSAFMQKLREDLPLKEGIYPKLTNMEKKAFPDSAYPFMFYSEKNIHLYIDDREIYADPYTGELLAVFYWGGAYRPFFDFILEGHIELWFPHPYGHHVVRYATLVFIVLLITGLVLWWPKNKAARKQRLWFKWKKTTQWRRKNYDLHNIPGFWTFLLTLLLAITGLGMGLDWFRDGLHWVFSGGKGHDHEEILMEPPPPIVSDTTLVGKENYFHYDEVGDRVVAIIDSLRPGNRGFGFIWPSMWDEKGVIRVFGGNELTGSNPTILIDKYSLEIIKLEPVKPKEEKDLAHTIEDLYRPIHEGYIWGLPTKILAFIGSLVGAFLPITGVYIWWGRKKKKKTPKKAIPVKQKLEIV